jgi:hypothetical protein
MESMLVITLVVIKIGLDRDLAVGIFHFNEIKIVCLNYWNFPLWFLLLYFHCIFFFSFFFFKKKKKIGETIEEIG